MANARLIGHRIRSGHFASASSITSTYEITAIATQTDQRGDTPWTAPAAEGTTPPRPAEFITALDESVVANGYYAWQWVFSYMTFDMYQYWMTTFCDTNAWYGDVTVMTYSEFDVAIYLKAKMKRPQNLAIAMGGYRDITFLFTHGEVIT